MRVHVAFGTILQRLSIKPQCLRFSQVIIIQVFIITMNIVKFKLAKCVLHNLPNTKVNLIVFCVYTNVSEHVLVFCWYVVLAKLELLEFVKLLLCPSPSHFPRAWETTSSKECLHNFALVTKYMKFWFRTTGEQTAAVLPVLLGVLTLQFVYGSRTHRMNTQNADKGLRLKRCLSAICSQQQPV